MIGYGSVQTKKRAGSLFLSACCPVFWAKREFAAGNLHFFPEMIYCDLCDSSGKRKAARSVPPADPDITESSKKNGG